MSQDRNSPIARNHNKYLNEEFFDLHPSPWEVDMIELTESVRIFIDTNNPETFLAEIKFRHWTESKFKTAVLQQKFRSSSVDVYRIGKSLFLRRLLF
jgi:hypothetical protein